MPAVEKDSRVKNLFKEAIELLLDKNEKQPNVSLHNF